MESTQQVGRIKARATIGAVKIHRENSPDVISGKVPLGHREEIQMDEPEQVIELTYEQCVEYFGQETADELFKGATHD